MDFLYKGLNAGASIKAVADLIGIHSRTVRRWGLDIGGQGYSVEAVRGKGIRETQLPEEDHLYREENGAKILAKLRSMVMHALRLDRF
jgi:transposase